MKIKKRIEKEKTVRSLTRTKQQNKPKNGMGTRAHKLDFASAWTTKLQSAEGAFVDEPVRTTMAEVAAPAD